MAKTPKHAASHLARMRALRARFDAVHAEAKAALRRKDYAALDAALRIEEQIIREQETMLREGRREVLRVWP